MRGLLTVEALERLVREGAIDTVLVCFPDMQGRLLGKRYQAGFFLERGRHEMHVCDYLLTVDMEMEPVPGYAAASWEKGYGDFTVRPDMATLRRIPWLEGTALVIGDCVDHHGTALPHSPRAMLKRQIARLAARDLTAMIGSELEFYIFEDSFEAAADKAYRGLRSVGRYIEDYHIFQTTKEEELVRTIRNAMEEGAVPIEFSKGEWGPGQAEINLRYAPALEMADRHAIYKNGAKEIAFRHGRAVTFMAKWREDLAGSSCHIHCSLWDREGDKPLFAAEPDDEQETRLFRHFIGGQIALAREMTCLLAPTINSYKRFQVGSFAPTRIAWSRDNRTAGFRVVGHGESLRIECRIPGADCNPYIAFAAVLAAGLYGIENELEPAPIVTGNVYQHHDSLEVPKTLREATALLDGSAALREAFGDDVIDHYVHAARWEQSDYDRRVTDWELQRLFERG